MRQSIIYRKVVDDKIEVVDKELEKVQSTMNELKIGIDRLNDAILSVSSVIGVLENLTPDEELASKLRELEAERFEHTKQKRLTEKSLDNLKPYLEKYTYAKEVLEDLLTKPSEKIDVNQFYPVSLENQFRK